MRTFITKPAIAVITFIVVAALATLTTDVTRKIERYQTVAMSTPQPGPEMLGNSYCETMNQLQITLGR